MFCHNLSESFGHKHLQTGCLGDLEHVTISYQVGP